MNYNNIRASLQYIFDKKSFDEFSKLGIDELKKVDYYFFFENISNDEIIEKLKNMAVVKNKIYSWNL